MTTAPKPTSVTAGTHDTTTAGHYGTATTTVCPGLGCNMTIPSSDPIAAARAKAEQARVAAHAAYDVWLASERAARAAWFASGQAGRESEAADSAYARAYVSVHGGSRKAAYDTLCVTRG